MSLIPLLGIVYLQAFKAKEIGFGPIFISIILLNTDFVLFAIE